MKTANYTVIGRVHILQDIETIETKKGDLLKRSLILEVPVKKGMWDRTNFVCFDVFNQGVHQLDPFDVGDDVEVEFTMKSNQGKKDPNRWFTSLYIQNIYREFVKTEEREEPSKKEEPKSEDDLNDLFARQEDLPDTLLDTKFNDLMAKPEPPKEKSLFDMDEWPDKPDDIQSLPF